MSFVGQVRPQVVDIFVTTAKYFAFFFTPKKILFSLSTISNVETKAFSFLLRIPDPPKLFSFPNDFRGNVEHFSKMQIQRIAVKTQERVPPRAKSLKSSQIFGPRCSRRELGLLLLQHSSTMRAKNFPQKKFVRQAKILRRFQLQRGIHQKLEIFTLISFPSKKTN